MAEYLDILDENGNPTGRTKLKSDVHRDGDWHRASHIWIINDKNELLIQQISPLKGSAFTGYWDISSAGHVSAGEDYLSAAVREVKEELGLNISKQQLELIYQYKAQYDHPNGKLNNEFDNVYLLRLNLNLYEINFQREEISDIKFIHYKDLQRKFKEENEFFAPHHQDYMDELFCEIEKRISKG